MNREVAQILKQRLVEPEPLPFISKYFGMVETVKVVQDDGNGVNMTKRMPVATEFTYVNPNGDLICYDKEQYAVPDSDAKGILYFEELGTKIGKYERGRIYYKSELDLVCWINVGKIKEDIYERIQTSAIQMILKRLNIQTATNEGFFIGLKVDATKIKPKNESIFSKYNYDVEHSQYLRPPFEYFSIRLEVTFSIHENCITNFETIDSPICR